MASRESSRVMIHAAMDIGNVLVHSDFNSFLKQLSKSLNITIEEATYFMNRTQKLHDLGCTKMADELRDHFHIRSPVVIDEIIASWNDIIKPNYYLLQRLSDMMATKDLQIALLSNIGLEHAVTTGQALNVGGFFDKCIKHFSCYVGARKPTVIYYQSFLQLHPEWQGCVYVDDLQENLDASKQFGFRPFRFALDEATTQQEKSFAAKVDELEQIISGL